MKKLTAFILALAILASITGIATALADPVTSADYPNEGYITYSVEYKPEKAAELLEQINEFRKSDAWYWSYDGTKKSAGVLDDLIVDDSLTEAAMYRAAQQAIYASHTQPSGAMACSGIHEDVQMENLAYGYETANRAFTALSEEKQSYAKQGHRRSMLSNATHVGVGCVTVNGITYWAIEYSFEEPTHEANTMMTEDTVTTLVDVEVVGKKYFELKASQASITCTVGNSMDLPAVIEYMTYGSSYIDPLETIPSDVSWTINDTSIATLSGNSVTGIKAGRTSASATLLGQTVNVSIIVEDAPVACTHVNTAERVTKEATCTADGSKEKYCTDCGTVVETVPIPQKGHTTAERVTKEATVTAEGATETYCTACGTVISTTSVPKKTCNHSQTSERVTKEATCTADGSKEKYCTDCGTIVETTSVPKKDHMTAERVTEEATVTAEGTKETYCTVCGTVISTTSVPKKTCSHSHTSGRMTKEATCTADGSKEKYCTDCGAVVETVTIPKKDHTTAERVTKEATVTTEGRKETYCTVCGTITHASIIPMLKPDLTSTPAPAPASAVVPACTNHNLVAYPVNQCYMCGREITTLHCTNEGCDYTECRIAVEGNHLWGPVTVITPATETNEGSGKHTCVYCDTAQTVVIPKLQNCMHEHTAERVTTEPTCWRTGQEEKYCQDCGTVLECRSLHTVDHEWLPEGHLIREATCESNGEIIYYCKYYELCRCTKGDWETLPPLGHDYQQNEEGKYICTRCRKEKPE